jgi:membrane-associated HD superfamily phosphohydrolase
MPILYFYAKAKKLTDGEVKIDQFCYPGPKPQTKISAIIMIVDSSEAAVRSMTDRSRETVFHMVDKIISDRIKLGQFDDCPLTMNDLSIIRHTIVNNLTGIYHKRIEYPRMAIEQLGLDEKAD